MGAFESSRRQATQSLPPSFLQSDNPFSLQESPNSMSRRISAGITRRRGTTGASAAPADGAAAHEPGSSASSASVSTSPPSSPKSVMWCFVKAKTKQHHTSKIIRKSAWYEGKGGNVLMIGRHESCGFRLEDDRCHSINAKLAPSSDPESNSIVLYPEARMYRMVGMAPKRTVDDNNVITLGSVIKVGSVSLEVTALCTDSHDDFYERFEREIDTGLGTTKRGANLLTSQSSRSIMGEDAIEDHDNVPEIAAQDADGAEQENVDSVAQAATPPEAHEKKMNMIQRAFGSILNKSANNTPRSSLKSNPPNEAVGAGEITEDLGKPDMEVEEDVSVASLDGDKTSQDLDDVMCYICWGGLDAGSSDGGKGEKGDEVNPLIRNPCGKCSGSSEYVHLQCILTWIESSGSGHCSICNGPLPQHFASPPPNIELKVVRHRRGESWVGTRRYRVNFRERSYATIGRDSDVEVRLGDRSVCNTHARITFDPEKREFRLSDCSSMTGTYIMVQEPVELLPQVTTYFKIGRTNLSMRVTPKRSSMLQSVLPPWNR